MQPDLEDYWSDLDGYDLTDEEKRQLIHTLWAMMESFVDSAFGVHPVQEALKAGAAKDSIRAQGVLELEEQRINETMLSPGVEAGRGRKTKRP